MSRRFPSKKSLPAAIGGILLVLAAGYFGFDLDGKGDSAGSDSASHVSSGGGKSGSGSLESCPIDTLPAEAEETSEDILAGGPYEFPENDNAHFGNYEGVLPEQANDYYREYTVETPGAGHRGAKRIVTGGGTEEDPDVWYYTDDHYESFCEIPDAED